jgi:hypothetical protein
MILSIRLITLALIIAVMVVSCTGNQEHATPNEAHVESVSAAEAFFQNLSDRCGDVYFGESVFPDDPDHLLYGAELKMTIESCTESQIRIPFQVNEDRSRTWILTLSDEGLLFKHDHRHEDGTPDEITNYGGWAAIEGAAPTKLAFPADEETAALLPEAATNVWTMELDLTNNQFTYFLERHSEPRYKAVFSLN